MIDPLRKTLLPTMTALTAFECAARHGSFTRAAAELNLTQGAVSRQIRQLEDQLGAQLFRRIRQRVVLTEAGRGYLVDVRRTLDHLEVATQRAMAYADGVNVLKLAVPPTFSATWLARRLPRFSALNPGVTINCAMRLPWFDQGTEKFDVAIHAAVPSLPNTSVQLLMRTRIVPVCSPGYRASLGLRTPGDLQRAALLHQTNRPLAWADWFDAAGINAPHAFRGPRFEHIAMLVRAAVAGMGVALAPLCIIEEETDRGLLKVLAPRSPCAELSFYLAIPEARQAVHGIRAFTEWILHEARLEPGAPATAVRSVPA
jgi:LysR family glycine cleavage system transcriptional activator